MNNFHAVTSYNPRVLVHHNPGVAFYWSPKSGCSVVAKMFLEYTSFIQPDVPIIRQRELYCKHIETTYKDKTYWCNQHVSVYNNYLKLQLVRNPYSRAISSYIKFLDMYKNNIALSFQSYLQLILTGKLLEHHMLPQYMIDKNLIDYILKLENIAQDVHYICNQYNVCFNYTTEQVELTYTRFHANNMHDNCSSTVFKIDNTGRIWNTYRQMYGMPEYKYFYNSYCKKMVEDIYGYDIEIFNYSFPY